MPKYSLLPASTMASRRCSSSLYGCAQALHDGRYQRRELGLRSRRVERLLERQHLVLVRQQRRVDHGRRLSHPRAQLRLERVVEGALVRELLRLLGLFLLRRMAGAPGGCAALTIPGDVAAAAAPAGSFRVGGSNGATAESAHSWRMLTLSHAFSAKAGASQTTSRSFARTHDDW